MAKSFITLSLLCASLSAQVNGSASATSIQLAGSDGNPNTDPIWTGFHYRRKLLQARRTRVPTVPLVPPGPRYCGSTSGTGSPLMLRPSPWRDWHGTSLASQPPRRRRDWAGFTLDSIFAPTT